MNYIISKAKWESGSIVIITNENDDEEIVCIVCGRKLASGDGRYNTLNGQVCIDCHSLRYFQKVDDPTWTTPVD